ncbi:MAP7 domain-containing protein 3 isoform X2 [Rhinoderma darwinii]|uniref:MAP7 domain-containing protein 3 isoform X2 n=1 Tax=Rhinoderma darwinii TaxID=43563 RepID=UPI003F67D1AF
MADGSGKLKGLREQMVAAAQAIADERRSQTGSSPIPVQSSVSVKTTKPVIDGSALRTDERQRLARERREEKERLNAAKEKELLEKEKKSKLQYEKQMEEKQKKLEEQKLKDEQKRVAAEEKRKQRLLEDKERREANVRRTLERSSQLDQRQKRWSWGGSAEGDQHGASGSSSPSHVDLINKNASITEPQPEDEVGFGAANMRSTSASNLKQADGSIHKRLSSSSATLEKGSKHRSSSLSRLSNKTPLSPQPFSSRVSNQEQKGGTGHKRSSSLSRLSSKKSPPAHLEGVKKEEKTAHRPPSSPLDSSLITRLLAPTQSSLARSKSAATLSAEGKELPESHLCPRSASATTTSTPPSVSKGPMRSRSIDRAKTPSTAASGSTTSEASQKSGLEKPPPLSIGKRPPSPTVTSRRRSPSPAGVAKRAPSPTLEKRNSSPLTQRNRPPSPSLLKQRAPSPTTTQKPVPIQRPSLTPSVLNATKKTADPETKPKEKSTDTISTEPKTPQTSEKEAATSKTKDEPSNKTISGSNTAEEAAKILAENRRLAREQREREEQERIQRLEEERIKQEEMARTAEEDRLRLEEETKLLEEKRKLEREEEQRLAQEEKFRRDQEEQERLAELQQQREEAETKALEEAEKQKQEREKMMQQNMQERLQRKKRIEEIMKRTRKNDQNDVKGDGKYEDDDDIGDEEKDLQEIDEDDLSEEADGPSEVVEQTDSQDSLSQKAAEVESDELFINGDRQDIEEKLNGHSSETAPALELSQVTDDTAILSEDEVHLNEDDSTGDGAPKLNGKSATWTFEEIIDLGIHSKPSNLSVDSIAMDNCNQDLIEAATIPPKLVFEEGQINSLSATIETAAEM